MRRSLSIIPLLVVIALLMTALPAAARSNIAIGWSVPAAGTHDVDAVKTGVQAYKAQVGRYPKVWSLWSRWGDRGADPNGPCVKGVGSCSFPTESVQYLHKKGITPMIWWVYVDPKDPRGNTNYAIFKPINQGKHDAYITQWLKDAKNDGYKNRDVIIRWAHEAEGRWFPWSIQREGNSVKSYKKAWNRLVNKSKAVNARKHVRWLWAAHTPKKVNYPGDGWVDYVGITVLNFGNHPDNDPPRAWKNAKAYMDKQASRSRKFTKKPIIVAEMGTDHIGGGKGKWIMKTYVRAWEKHPLVKAIVYLQAPHDPVEGPDWRLDVGDGGWGLKKYIDLAKQKRFQGSLQ